MLIRSRMAARIIRAAPPSHAIKQAAQGSLLQRKVFNTPWVSRRGLSQANATAASSTSTIAEICEWAGRKVSERGAGLQEEDVVFLRRERIQGSSLFRLTDAELRSVGMSLGARKDLLAAVALLKELPEHTSAASTVAGLEPIRTVLQPAAFDHHEVIAAARAHYTREDEFVDVDYTFIAAGSITRLPFVNRVEQLCDAARALVHNVMLSRSSTASDSRMAKLVFCSQLFGSGKTSFAERVAVGLNVAYGGKQSYVQIEGLPANVSSADASIAHMVIEAAERGKVILSEEAARLRLPGFCALSSVLLFVQERLAANERVPGAVSQLFLHFDEFDLSNFEVIEFEHLRDKTLRGRYDYVWRQLLLPILRQPNLHLIVTGKSPELALLGTSGDGTSPSLAHHAVLGTLDAQHIVDVLHRLRVQRTPGSTFDSAASVLGLPVRTNLASDAGVIPDPLWSALVSGLRSFTAGVPRFLCLSLGHLLRMRVDGSLPPLSDLTSASVDELFDPASALYAAMLTGNSSTFVKAPVDALCGLVADGSGNTRAQLTQLLIDVYCESRATLSSPAGRAMVLNAAKFGAYTDRVPGSGSDTIKVVMPGILQGFWRSSNVMGILEAGFLAYLQLVASQSASAGTLGDELEDRFGAALRFHWALSAIRGEATGSFRDLLVASRRLDGVDVVFNSSVVVDCDHPMGKVGNTAKTRPAFDLGKWGP